MHDFDPSGAAQKDAGIYGLPFSYEDSKIVVIPVPWDVTTSYGKGTSMGPSAVLQASYQMDLFDRDLGRFYEKGIFMLPENSELFQLNKKSRVLAEQVIEQLSEGKEASSPHLESIQKASEFLNKYVKDETSKVLAMGKIPVILGGDHSVPFGAFEALSGHIGTKSFGILHFDAHHDLRESYMGMEYSHASIMFNACEKIPNLKKLVQVGIRDYCEEEYLYAKERSEKVKVFYDVDLSRRKLRGESWAKIVEDIVHELPENLWISFDIDGLNPVLCPNTGTPVPGGLEFAEVMMLLDRLVASKIKIMGCDLVEVAPDKNNPANEWDANVGMRLMYKMMGYSLKSQSIL